MLPSYCISNRGWRQNFAKYFCSWAHSVGTAPIWKWGAQGEISGVRREVDENCDLLGYYAVSSGNFLPTFRDNLSVPSSGVNNPKMILSFIDPWRLDPIGCTETSAINCRYLLRNSPEERSSYGEDKFVWNVPIHLPDLTMPWRWQYKLPPKHLYRCARLRALTFNVTYRIKVSNKTEPQTNLSCNPVWSISPTERIWLFLINTKRGVALALALCHNNSDLQARWLGCPHASSYTLPFYCVCTVLMGRKS
jgi:hypothetical protein